MLKCMYIFLTVLVCVGTAVPIFAAQVDVDVLMQTMVDEGLISPAQAEQIVAKSQEKIIDEKIAHRDEVEEILEESRKLTKKITLHGDVTIRTDHLKTKLTPPRENENDQFRGRLRYRLGMDVQMNSVVKLGAGFSSGGADPRSSFMTFTNSSERGDIRLDYAYAELTPTPWTSAIVGQFPKENYLWYPTDMVWDSDIRPQGGAVHLETPSLANFKFFANSGVMILDEALIRQDDPTMYWFQPGVSYDNTHVDAKFAVTRYVFNSVKRRQLAHGSCTNTGYSFDIDGNCNGTLNLEYDSGSAAAEVGYKFDFFGRHERIAFFGEGIKNLTMARNDIGWAGGTRFGDAAIEKFGDWQGTYQYTLLQKDAVLDIFPSSDRYDGNTDVTGIKGRLDFGLWKDIVLGVTYYHDKRIRGTNAPRTALLTDVMYKF